MHFNTLRYVKSIANINCLKCAWKYTVQPCYQNKSLENYCMVSWYVWYVGKSKYI